MKVNCPDSGVMFSGVDFPSGGTISKFWCTSSHYSIPEFCNVRPRIKRVANSEDMFFGEIKGNRMEKDARGQNGGCTLRRKLEEEDKCHQPFVMRRCPQTGSRCTKNGPAEFGRHGIVFRCFQRRDLEMEAPGECDWWSGIKWLI